MRNGVASIVRIVDKHLLNPKPPLPEGIKQAIEVVGFFSVKSGDIKGEGELSLMLRKPDGSSWVLPEKWNVLLNGDEHGANLRVSLTLPVVYGLYWLDLRWNGEHLTSAPFRFAPTVPGEAGRQAPDSSSRRVDCLCSTRGDLDRRNDVVGQRCQLIAESRIA